MKNCIVIPTYNEKENIEGLIRTIFRINFDIKILIIDDNSPDGTGKIIDNLKKEFKNLYVIHRKEKAGLGSAYIEGFNYIIKNMNEVENVISMDADFSHDSKLIPIFIENIKDYNLIIGSRYIKGGGFKNCPMYRKLISRCANIYGQLLLGIKIKDISSGYRCYKKDILSRINFNKFENFGYAFLEEMLFYYMRISKKTKEIPIIFVDRTKGKTKLNKKEMFNFFWGILKLRLKNGKA